MRLSLVIWRYTKCVSVKFDSLVVETSMFLINMGKSYISLCCFLEEMATLLFRIFISKEVGWKELNLMLNYMIHLNYKCYMYLAKVVMFQFHYWCIYSEILRKVVKPILSWCKVCFFNMWQVTCIINKFVKKNHIWQMYWNNSYHCWILSLVPGTWPNSLCRFT